MNDNRKQEIKRMRDEEKLTFHQIGERLGISRQAVQQLYSGVPAKPKVHKVATVKSRVKRGRVPGSCNVDSWNSWLCEFELGEKRYVETTPETYASDMRIMCTPKSRRPLEAAGKEWSASLFTCISASDFRDVRYVICVERTE